MLDYRGGVFLVGIRGPNTGVELVDIFLSDFKSYFR